MMHAAIDHEIGLAPRDLAVNDLGDIDTALADDVPAELDDKLRLRKLTRQGAVNQRREIITHQSQVERLVLLEVGDAEATAQVDVPNRLVKVPRQLQHEIDRTPLRLTQDFGLQVLGASEDMEAEKIHVTCRQIVK